MYSSREHEYAGIETHDGHAAINVRHYGSPELPEEDEPFGEQAYENVRSSWWTDATEMAHERGYSCVFQEGRSGGWLVPFYQSGQPFYRWPGQGGALGYPFYPNMDEIGERSRFRAYQRRIVAMLKDVQANIQAEATFLREQALEAVV